jgi:hypothetical protein
VQSYLIKDLYVVDRVLADTRAAERAERLCRGLAGSGKEPRTVSRAQLAEIRKTWPWHGAGFLERRTGSFDYSDGWTVILDTYRSHDAPNAEVPMSSLRDGAQQNGSVCQTALELHAALGCFHRCAYCHCNPHFTICCDLERLAEELPQIFDAHPAQQLYKFDNFTDTLLLEPEYGASELLVPLFADAPDRYLLLYTKSDNVHHLLGLRHGGHTIINWSLSPRTQSRRIEVGSPETEARIEAMRRCRDAGYTVRCRLSPIVPLRGWEAELHDMLNMLFARVSPDSITLDVVGWCHPAALLELLNGEELEEPFRSTLAGLAAEDRRTTHKHLFPHAERETILHGALSAIRDRAPATRVALCNETPAMWRALRDFLPMPPDDYFCCCGPTSVPGWQPRQAT